MERYLSYEERLQFAHDLLASKPLQIAFYGDFVFVCIDPPQEQTDTGIWLAENAQELPHTGTVIAVGLGIRGDDEKGPSTTETGRRVAGLEIGDTVMFGRYVNQVVQVPWPGHDPVEVFRVHATDVMLGIRENNGD